MPGVIALLSALALSLAASLAAAAPDPMSFWNQPRHGGNSFNRLPPDQAYFDALRAHGADWVRLSYDKWRPQGKDFLMGDADDYRRLSPQDLPTLKQVLERIGKAGLKAVITPLSLPYARWSQNNGGRFDDRLWQDRRRWQQAVRFWRDLAQALRGQPAIAAYNLINEPAPEKMAGLPEHADAAAMQRWYAGQGGGARDLPAFYGELIAAIREVDPDTPIMVDAGWYAAADAFAYWPAPLADRRVLYSFHMYEPYATTSAPNAKRSKPYTYPGETVFAGAQQLWDRRRVAAYLRQPLEWARSQGLPMTRMVAGEFGCIRTLDSCSRYLDDVLDVLQDAGVHWAFYAFREDAWDAMDYELGRGKVPWAYWKAAEEGRPDPVPRKATPEFEVIRKRLKGAP